MAAGPRGASVCRDGAGHGRRDPLAGHGQRSAGRRLAATWRPPRAKQPQRERADQGECGSIPSYTSRWAGFPPLQDDGPRSAFLGNFLAQWRKLMIAEPGM